MVNKFSIVLSEEQMQQDLSQNIADFLKNKTCITYLSGQMGAGKTALIRSILYKMNYTGNVTSPSFNLINVYDLKTPIIHCDLYRFKNFDAPEMLMIDDYYNTANYFIEWPENAAPKTIPAADIIIDIKPANNYNSRLYTIISHNEKYVFSYKKS